MQTVLLSRLFYVLDRNAIFNKRRATRFYSCSTKINSIIESVRSYESGKELDPGRNGVSVSVLNPGPGDCLVPVRASVRAFPNKDRFSDKAGHRQPSATLGAIQPGETSGRGDRAAAWSRPCLQTDGARNPTKLRRNQPPESYLLRTEARDYSNIFQPLTFPSLSSDAAKFPQNIG